MVPVPRHLGYRAGVRCLSVLSMLLILSGAARAADGAPEVGSWLVQDGSSVVAIAPCGGGLCGRLVGIALDHPTDAASLDIWGGSQCGEQIIAMPRLGQDGRWHGTILDPRSGHRWQAQIWQADGRLHLRGFLGLPLFGQTQTWTQFAGRTRPGNCAFTR